MDSNNWMTLSVVTEWLGLFREATVLISRTSKPTLSGVCGISESLQDHIAKQLSELPDNAHSALQQRLLAAHRKLSDYYAEYELSPYYRRASCESPLHFCRTRLTVWSTPALDPRCSYRTMHNAYQNDPVALGNLNININKKDLATHLVRFYCAPTPSGNITAKAATLATPLVRLVSLSRLLPWSRTTLGELERCFLLDPEPEIVDPVKWWALRCSQFPTLAKLARDILSIPGKLSHWFYVYFPHADFRFSSRC